VGHYPKQLANRLYSNETLAPCLALDNGCRAAGVVLVQADVDASRLIWRFSTVERGALIHKYWSSDCPRCAMKEKCTPSPYRRVARGEYESSLEAMQKRLDKKPEAMRTRRQTVEHPFGTLKDWMGATHFLTRTLERVSTEMSLHVLAYNLKRVMKIIGIADLKAAMQA